MILSATMGIALPEPSERWALFLDFDGTLVEIVERPDLVRLPPAARETLERIGKALDGALAVVSGRTIEDLDRHIGPPPFAAAGIHGLERRGPDGRITRIAADAVLDRLRARIEGPLQSLAGVLREDKGLSIALHWRMAARHEAAVQALLREATADLPDITLVGGKCVLEARIKGADKGSAIAAFMAEPPFRGRLPVFVGDDRTDEDGFAAVAAMGGIAVKVGEEPTLAQHRIRDVRALRAWLSLVSRALEGRRAGAT